MMRQLPDEFSWLYNQFVEERHHSIFRSSHNWRGIWTDLAIEQVLMRSQESWWSNKR